MLSIVRSLVTGAFKEIFSSFLSVAELLCPKARLRSGGEKVRQVGADLVFYCF